LNKIGLLARNSLRVSLQALAIVLPTATGVTSRLWEMKDIVEMIEAWEAVQD